MATTAKLRKENQDLRKEIAGLQEKLEKLTQEISSKSSIMVEQEGNHASQPSNKDKSIEFISAQYDDIILFKNNAIKELNDIKKQVTTISKKCEVIATSIHQIEDYSYQYNIKIVGMPEHDENESAEHTLELCLNLFTALGANVSMQDIDISHRIPARRQTGQQNAIVCKFVRRLAKERVFEINNINPQQLGLPQGTHLNNLDIFEHLPPRLQELYLRQTNINGRIISSFAGQGTRLSISESQRTTILLNLLST